MKSISKDLEPLHKDCEPIQNIEKVKIIYQDSCISPTDYGGPERKLPSLQGRKFNPNPKLLGTAEAYFVCHMGPKFKISLVYAFIGCP